MQILGVASFPAVYQQRHQPAPLAHEGGRAEQRERRFVSRSLHFPPFRFSSKGYTTGRLGIAALIASYLPLIMIGPGVKAPVPTA